MKENQFVSAGLNIIESEEGAVKLASTNNVFVDQFASAGNYLSPRDLSAIFKDTEVLWAADPTLSVKFIFYLRMISRDTKHNGKVYERQKGQGLRFESISRMLWLAYNHPKAFYNNLYLFASVGSWKDVFDMLRMDLSLAGTERKYYLDWKKVFGTLTLGLSSENSNLIKKYMPTIRPKSKQKTFRFKYNSIIGKLFAKYLFDETDVIKRNWLYRQLKSSGNAHDWQQLISEQAYNSIDFNTIPGIVLKKMVDSKFLDNHNLTDKYFEWIKTQDTVKYNGYVHDLFTDLTDKSSLARMLTTEAQFQHLVKNTKLSSNLLVVRDTSGSMTAAIKEGSKVTSFNVAKAMALYFSYFLKGEFSDCWVEFNRNAEMHKWNGGTAVAKWFHDTSSAYGSTNFLAVIDLLVSIKERGVAESEFPEGILCLSDGEFSNNGCFNQTNYKAAIQKLKDAGFSKEYIDNFKIILWDIPNTFYGNRVKNKFEESADTPNFFHIAGFDGSIISFIVEGNRKTKSIPKTSEELFLAAMDQEILDLVQVSLK